MQLQRNQEKVLIERNNMKQEIERIDLEIESIAILAKKLILEADINLGLLSELIQVIDKRISELAYVKDHIMAWEDPEDKFIDLKIGQNEPVFIKSKTDGDWISVLSIKLLEKGQIFTTKIGQEKGEEYKLISSIFPEVISDSVYLYGIRVEKVQG